MTRNQIVKVVWPNHQDLNFGEIQQVARETQEALCNALRKVRGEKIRKLGQKKKSLRWFCGFCLKANHASAKECQHCCPNG